MPESDWHFQGDDAKKALSERNSYLEFLRSTCTADSDFDAAAILFTELVANVVRHAAGRIQISVRADRHGSVMLEVEDSGAPFAFAPSLPSITSEGGRGLYIISKLSADVSLSRNGDGNAVRVKLPVDWASSP
jgi:anti-sigma regulatory factor (Ser/Thr protein kinase)